MIHDEISEGVFSFPVALPSFFFFFPPIINLLGFKYKLLPSHTLCMEEVWFYYGNHASKVGSFQTSLSPLSKDWNICGSKACKIQFLQMSV